MPIRINPKTSSIGRSANRYRKIIYQPLSFDPNLKEFFKRRIEIDGKFSEFTEEDQNNIHRVEGQLGFLMHGFEETYKSYRRVNFYIFAGLISCWWIIPTYIASQFLQIEETLILSIIFFGLFILNSSSNPLDSWTMALRARLQAHKELFMEYFYFIE